MKTPTNHISQNLTELRRRHKYSQEEVAEKIGVSRQAVAKWETGETLPDILNCDALAALYDVSLDDLLHFDPQAERMPIPPRGKHLFGTVRVGERGQVVLPKKARELFSINPGDLLVALGDENPESAASRSFPATPYCATLPFCAARCIPARRRTHDRLAGSEGPLQALCRVCPARRILCPAPRTHYGPDWQKRRGQEHHAQGRFKHGAADAGSVSMLGEDFFGNERKCKQRVGVVFGGVDFYPLKRLRTITAVTCRFYPNWDQQAYEGYLRRFALDESKPFRTLSEGMKVKYLLALALSHDALIYILDEPTSGLDPVSREEILRIFRRIVRDGRRAVLFSTHITSDLERCADDITYIRDGRVLQSADRETFLRSFDHLKTPGETGNLTLEEIMLRTEGREADEAAL